jgi:hypothetical protein
MSLFRRFRKLCHCEDCLNKSRSQSTSRQEQWILEGLDEWRRTGCPTFCLDGKRSAVFAATSCHEVVLSDMISPFDAFGILLDEALFPECCDGFIFVIHLLDQMWQLVIGSTRGLQTQILEQKDFLNDILAAPLEKNLVPGFVHASPDEWQRAGAAARRIVAGVCLSLDHSGNALGCKTRTHHPQVKQELSGYSEYRFTGPVPIDIRAQVKENISTGGGALHVQTLVRGHWKMQPCGPGRAERKHIHVMPYWKGPIDAPVALRCPKEDPFHASA